MLEEIVRSAKRGELRARPEGPLDLFARGEERFFVDRVDADRVSLPLSPVKNDRSLAYPANAQSLEIAGPRVEHLAELGRLVG